MTKCQIKWIDKNGQPTPDDNESIGQVRLGAYVHQLHGRAIQYKDSDWFHICAEHAKQMTDPGMHNWQWKCES